MSSPSRPRPSTGWPADATNGIGVARIFEAKGRPRFNPLIAHVADIAMAERIAVFDPLSKKLAEAFWPGPLTLVLPQRSGNAHPSAGHGRAGHDRAAHAAGVLAAS